MSPGFVTSGSPISLSRFRRAPVTHRPLRAATGSLPTLISRFLPSSTEMFGNRPRSMAMAPDTCGVAIEVPEKSWYVLPGVEDQICRPGAAMSTVVAP